MNHLIKTYEINGLEAIKQLLQNPDYDPAYQDNEAIRFCSSNGYSEVVKLLLQHPRVNPADDDNYAIRWASRCGNYEVVRLLLKDPRVNPAAKDNYPIRWADKNCYLEVVKLLLSDLRVLKNEIRDCKFKYYIDKISASLPSHWKELIDVSNNSLQSLALQTKIKQILNVK